MHSTYIYSLFPSALGIHFYNSVDWDLAFSQDVVDSDERWCGLRLLGIPSELGIQQCRFPLLEQMRC